MLSHTQDFVIPQLETAIDQGKPIKHSKLTEMTEVCCWSS
jgi:hypothetical protein